MDNFNHIVAPIGALSVAVFAATINLGTGMARLFGAIDPSTVNTWIMVGSMVVTAVSGWVFQIIRQRNEQRRQDWLKDDEVRRGMMSEQLKAGTEERQELKTRLAQAEQRIDQLLKLYGDQEEKQTPQP